MDQIDIRMKLLETVRRELALLLTETAYFSTVFAALVLVHSLLTTFQDIAGHADAQSVFRFFEYAAFGTIAFIGVVIIVRAMWRIARAVVAELSSRSNQ